MGRGIAAMHGPSFRRQFSDPMLSGKSPPSREHVAGRCAQSLLLVILSLACWLPATVSLTAQELRSIDFSHEIVPVLRENCVECHGGDNSEGGFSINTRELILDAAAAEPGQSDASHLMERVVSEDDDFRMPPADKPRLSSEKVELLRQWIDAGLPWEAGFTFAATGYEPPLAPRRPELPPSVDGRNNPIDRILDAYLSSHELEPSGAIDDATFARRVYLDLVGMLPPLERLAEFLASESTSKRPELIDELLADRRAYAEHWLTFWNDLLRNDYVGTGYIDGGRKHISGWLYRALEENKPFDQFTRELIAPAEEAEGFIRGIKWRGDVNASQRPELQFAQNVSQVFLGMNLKCASCHDSFIDPWTLEETYGLAAVYATEPLEMHRCDQALGQTAAAGWIYPELGNIDPQAPQKERLEQLAELVTCAENGLFARTIVNRLWHQLMGRGIIYPMEAMQTPPFSADLIDWLASDFVEHGFDLKHTLRLIATSHAYQSRWVSLSNEAMGEAYVYQAPAVKRLTAEQFMDALWQLTKTGPAEPNKRVTEFLPPAEDRPFYRAALRESDLLMRSLGRPNREQVVTVRPADLTKLQALELFNSQILTDTLHAGAESLLAAYGQLDSAALIETVYRSALSRPPTPPEREVAAELLGTPLRIDGLQDLLWAIVMLPEFQLIH
jgi:hypothetical protein